MCICVCMCTGPCEPQCVCTSRDIFQQSVFSSHCAFWGLNSGCHACTASTFTQWALSLPLTLSLKDTLHQHHGCSGYYLCVTSWEMEVLKHWFTPQGHTARNCRPQSGRLACCTMLLWVCVGSRWSEINSGRKRGLESTRLRTTRQGWHLLCILAPELVSIHMISHHRNSDAVRLKSSDLHVITNTHLERAA